MKINKLIFGIAAAVVVALVAVTWVATGGKVWAGPDDLLLNQRNSTDTGNIQRIPPHPTANWGLLAYDPSTLGLSWLTLSSSFTINSGILDVVAPSVAWTSITGKPSFATVATSGDYNDLINKPSAATFNFGLPAAKTVAVSTDLQAADPSKAAIITPSFACQNATTVVASSACTLQVRVSSSAVTCSTGTVLYTVSQTVQLGVLLTQAQTVPAPIHLPIGAHFIVCPSSGTFTITATEQTAG